MTPFQQVWLEAPTFDLMSMVLTHHDYNNGNEMGSTMIDYNTWKCEALTTFMNYVLGVLTHWPERGKLLAFSVVTPLGKKEGGWVKGYPHRHPYAYRTLSHYLSPGDAFAPLVVLDDETEKTHFLTPAEGLTVVIPGGAYHGILDSSGTSPRVTLVVQSVPEDLKIDATQDWRFEE